MTFDSTQAQATLGLRYGNIRKIGDGGMGCVFSAYDAVLKRAVAAKLVFDWHEKSELAVRFHQEAKLASRLNHQNIVKVMDFGIGQNGIIYLIMDLVEGSSLRQTLKESGPMSVDAAIPMFIQVCAALTHAHNHGIVHRDLKPNNIMLASEESVHTNVRVVDFGIAKVINSDQKITRTGQIIGTPLYSSPEQIQSKPVDQRSDIYSFGCVMLEVLTGSPPFRGATQVESYEMHLKQPAPRLLERGFQHQHAAELDRIIATALNKDPNERYQSFSQLQAELIELLSEESKAAVHEVAERYAKNKHTAKNFVAQFKYALVAFAALIAIVGSAVIYQNAHRKPIIRSTTAAEFGEHGYGFSPQESEWRFFCAKREGLDTWTNIDCRMSDQHFKQLQGKNVRSVFLYAMRLEGSGLKYLRDEPLEQLSVSESKIIDKNLHYIGDLKGLKSLNISYTWITDAGVKTISVLPKLTTLGMAGCTKLTSKSIDSVCNLAPEVVKLDISYTPVGKDGYEKLQNLAKLKNLDLTLSDLTDDTIEPIFKLTNLTDLTISKNKQLTDATLSKLKQMRKLKMLKIDNCCGFTPKGIASLKKALPTCLILTEKKPMKQPEVLEGV